LAGPDGLAPVPSGKRFLDPERRRTRMLVEKINNEYRFTSPTVDGAFVVKLTLKGKEESLNTISVPLSASFPQRKLKPGTIRASIGEERWKNFMRMKKLKLATMFIEPHSKGFIPQNF
jgi:hypothetical protein